MNSQMKRFMRNVEGVMSWGDTSMSPASQKLIKSCWSLVFTHAVSSCPPHSLLLELVVEAEHFNPNLLKSLSLCRYGP